MSSLTSIINKYEQYNVDSLGRKQGSYLKCTPYVHLECQYQDDLMHGESREWYVGDKDYCLETFKNLSDKHDFSRDNSVHPKFQLIYLDQYVLGLRNGESKYWTLNGILSMTKQFKDDRANGETKTYYDNEQVKLLITYKDDVLHGPSGFWHANGLLGSKRTYINGNLEGKAISWHNNGQVESIYFYNNGLIVGETNCWHKNGQLFSLGFYEQGRLEGIYRCWNSQGVLILHQVYSKGVIVKINLDFQKHFEFVSVC